MAKLTEDQKKSVAQWAADGATLNQIQDRLRTEFSLTLTYMDTRLLVMELGLKLHGQAEGETSGTVEQAVTRGGHAGGCGRSR